MNCTPEVRRFMEATYIAHAQRVQRWLQRKQPRARPELIEEAVAQAFADLCAHPCGLIQVHKKDGEGGVLRYLCCVARRRLISEGRKLRARCETLNQTDLPPEPHADETARLDARVDLKRCVRLVVAAARLKGHGRPEQLEAALWACFQGEFEAEAARRFEVRREYVSRARRWLHAELHADDNAPAVGVQH